MTNKIIMDLDVGVDDAMALLIAFYEPQFEIRMISTVYGNVGIDQATKNTCFLVEKFAQVDYPVYKGAERALKSEPVNAMEVHGRTGLGTKIVARGVHKTPANYKGYGALEAIRDYINKEPGEIILLTVGPTTNIANLITTYPEVVPKIKQIVMEVGSTDGKGSITPYASFNAYCDPEAVDIIIHSGVPILLTTKEIGTTAYFEQPQRERFGKLGKVGPFIYDLCEGYRDKILKEGQYAVHDSCALLALLKTDIFTYQKVDMKINTSNDEKRGQTKFKPNENSHITLVTSVDKAKLFKKMEQVFKRS